MAMSGGTIGAASMVVDLVGVRGHVRNQAYGPGYSQHRETQIKPYVRRAA